MQWKSIRETNCVMHWVEIYLVDSIIHLLNNWPQPFWCVRQLLCALFSVGVSQTL